jgi:GNAT superfamily N-acetyltransferase
MTRVDVTVVFLEMASPAQLVPGRATPERMRIQREAGADAPTLAAELYRAVGQRHQWRDRADWSHGQWSELLADPSVELWTARRDGALVGYFELKRAERTVELKYFGVLPDAIGRGIGGWMLTEAVQLAWRPGVERVLVNTCTLDHPAALPNYLARGFSIVRREHQRRNVPE